MVDLVIGTVLFRDEFVAASGRGHVDLPRLRVAGVDLIGLTLATRFPNLRGTLSALQFRSLGIPVGLGTGDMEIAETLIRRIRRWADDSNGGLALLEPASPSRSDASRTTAETDAVRAFIGVQGAHVLDGNLANVERLRDLGVRMLALAHVMDNEAVGSGTGARRGGVTSFGRELIAELERVGILVDLAHMSSAGINDAVPLLRRPFVLSHTGFVQRAGASRFWSSYSAATRNISRADAKLVADAGGVIGVTVATQLVGGRTPRDVLDGFTYAVELCGVQHVAVGSDFDGALEMVFDVTGLPLITQGLLDRGMSRDEVAAVMGGNALRVLGETPN